MVNFPAPCNSHFTIKLPYFVNYIQRSYTQKMTLFSNSFFMVVTKKFKYVRKSVSDSIMPPSNGAFWYPENREVSVVLDAIK